MTTNFDMKVGVSKAAKLTGKTRTTIYNHVKSGKISAEFDGVKGCQIDISELTRFYGNLQNPDMQEAGEKMSTVVKKRGQNLTEERLGFLEEQVDFFQELLEKEREEKKFQLEFLRKQLEQEREEKNRLLSLVENQTKQLTDQRKRNWWSK